MIIYENANGLLLIGLHLPPCGEVLTLNTGSCIKFQQVSWPRECFVFGSPQPNQWHQHHGVRPDRRLENRHRKLDPWEAAKLLPDRIAFFDTNADFSWSMYIGQVGERLLDKRSLGQPCAANSSRNLMEMI